MLVIVVLPVVHESLVSLQVDVNGFLKSHVNGLLSGLLLHVAIPSMLFAEQLIGVPGLHVPD